MRYGRFAPAAALCLVACARTNFGGGSSAVKYGSLDASGKTGAQLRHVPHDPSNDTSLAVEVFGVDEYSFLLIAGDADCDAQDRSAFSGYADVSQPITGPLGADGRYTLCVFGMVGTGPGALVQDHATVAKWTKRTVLPGEFAIKAPLGVVGSLPALAAWDASTDAASYDVVVATDAGCKDSVVGKTGIVGTGFDPGKLADGDYHVCVEAVDAAGNRRAARNDGAAFTLAAVPPGAFTISQPSALTKDAKAVAHWSAAAAAETSKVTYAAAIAKDQACETVVTSGEALTATQFAPASALADGSYFLCVDAVDVAGHRTRAANAPYSFTVDTVGLVPAFDPATLPANPANVTILAVKLLPDPDLAAFKLKTGPAATTDCDSDDGYPSDASTDVTVATTIDLANAADGDQVLCAIAADRAGNWVGSGGAHRAASFTWKKVTEAPTVAFTVPAACGPLTCVPSSTTIPLTATAVKTALAVPYRVDVSVAVGGACLGADGKADADCPAWQAAAVTSGGFSYAVPKSALMGEATVEVTARAVDAAGNESQPVAHAMIWDPAAPQVTRLSLHNKPSTRSATVPVDVQATDVGVGVAQICLVSSSDGTVPSPSATCWQPLTSSSVVTLPGFTVGYTPGTLYTVYAWAKDAVGNVSKTPLTDKITYAPVPVPLLNDVLATSTDKPSRPPSIADRTAPAGGSVYVKWTAVQQAGGDPLEARSIALAYTTDDVTWHQIASGLALTGSGTCTRSAVQANPAYTDQEAGCYVWPSPASGYFRIRVAVADVDGQITYSTSPALNVSHVNYLAGNTEIGIGASARSTVFQNGAPNPADVDPGILVADAQGDFFYMDRTRGLFVVDTNTGTMSLLLPIDAKATVTAAATDLADTALLAPYGMTLTPDDGVVIADANRLRLLRYNGGDHPTIETLAGGGTSRDDTVTNPLALYMEPILARSRLLFATPDGKIYFRSEDEPGAGNRFRIYDPATKRVTSLRLTGSFTWPTQTAPTSFADCLSSSTAFGFDPATGQLDTLLTIAGGNIGFPDDNTCKTNVSYRLRWAIFNPAAGALQGRFVGNPTADDVATLGGPTSTSGAGVTGLKGSLWWVDHNIGVVSRFDKAAKKFVPYVGTGVAGSCPDGTPATSCAISPVAAFVDRSDRVFFVDGSRIRTVESRNGQNVVVTVFGQALSYGDGLDPLSARIGLVDNFGQWTEPGTGRVRYTLMDGKEARIREFSEGTTAAQPSSAIATLAGNGLQGPLLTVANGGTATTDQSVPTTHAGYYFDDFALDATNGAAYVSNFGLFPSGSYGFELVGLDRGTGLWSRFGGGGSVDWRTVTGTPSHVKSTDVGLAVPSGYAPRILGYGGGEVLVVHNWYNPYQPVGHTDATLSTFGVGTGGLMTFVGGARGVALNYGAPLCGLGTPLADCTLYNTYDPSDYTHAQYLNGQWLLGMGHQPVVYTVAAGGTLGAFETLARGFQSFVYRPASAGAANGTVYYCGLDGNLYKHVRGTTTDTRLTIGSSQMLCTGRTMYWNDSRGSVSFAYRLNGLYGLAEYVDP